ncbi:MAG: tetratricopeptide repeat protein [Acidobacteria bacterium]|nr:tetratricopeptide repeat protein [Acidobacteriota bacterium]
MISRTIIPLVITVLLLSAPLVWAAEEQPRYDLRNVHVFAEIQTVDNRIDALADVQISLLDQTNFVTLRLNGNLTVAAITDEQGESLRFIQDDTDRFEVLVNFGRPLDPGVEKTLSIQYSGIFPRSQFDFFREIGAGLYSYIGEDMVELYGSALWFPAAIDELDLARYEIQFTLPVGMQPVTAGRLTDTIETGLNTTYVFKTEEDIMAPSFLAARYIVEEMNLEGFAIKTWLLSEFADTAGIFKAIGDVLTFMKNKQGLELGDRPLNIVEVSADCHETFGMDHVVFLKATELKAKNPVWRDIIRKIAYQKWLFPLEFASPNDIWIAEGLAQYTAALYILEREGEEEFESTMELLAVDALKYLEMETVYQGIRLGIGSLEYNSVVVAKSAWVFHMLRYLIGAEDFEKILQRISALGQNEALDTPTMIRLLKEVSDQDYKWFLDQWIFTVDLPQFSTEYLIYRLTDGGFQTVGKINQNIAVFQFPLEVKVISQGQDEMKVIDVKGESSRMNFTTETRPLQLVLDPEFKILRRSRNLEIRVHVVKGDEFLENGDFLDAIEEYKEAINMDPRGSLGYYKLARVFYEQFNYSSALNTFRDALNGDQEPDWVVAMCHVYMGKIFDVLGQRQRAVAEYNKAINTQDNSRGAVDEAQQYLSRPFTREKTFLTSGSQGEKDEKPPEAPDLKKSDDAEKQKK